MADAASARLYALTDPDQIASETDAITRLVLEALAVAPSARHQVDISPGGSLDYRMTKELWVRRSPPQLPDRAAAQKAAETVLARLEKACSDVHPRWPKSLRGTALLPPVATLRPATLAAVARPDGSAWDHWLYRAEPRLRIDGVASPIGVYGSQVEVRIGHGGMPITIRSRWRPLSGEEKLTDLTPFRAPPGLELPDTDTPPTPPLNYLFQGEGIPQYYLAPYYCIPSDAGAALVTASPFSLTGHIARTAQADGQMTVSAFARGGSGRYSYNWAYYPLVGGFAGIREIGPGRSFDLSGDSGRIAASSITLGSGAYVVLLNISDRATGAFKHEQRQVFSAPDPSTMPVS